MIRATTFVGKTVALFGLGASGNATAAALAAGGATVAAWDDTAKARDDARAVGIDIVDLNTADWSRFSSLVLAPGVPLTHPKPHWTALRAKAAGIEVIGDIEIFARERAANCPNSPFIAITGTNGKSTTTALVAHILRAAGRDVQMGGNIGVPILTLEPPALDRFHVVELSSFQIDLTPTLRPTIGVLLNITPDHIERHGTLAQYAAVKERLIAGADLAVIGCEDARCRTTAAHWRDSGKPVVSIATTPDADVYFSNGALYRRGSPAAVATLAASSTLRGAHNGENAAAALAVLLALGMDDATIARHMLSYPGLPHRMEEVGRMGSVLFINDSKATNADSTEKALLSFSQDIFWILGGKAKDGGIESLRDLFPRIAKAYLIGASSDAFAATLDGHVPFERCGTIDVALAHATADASHRAAAVPSGSPVVLLSPACASYDQFRTFEHRGDVFRDLVSNLPGVVR